MLEAEKKKVAVVVIVVLLFPVVFVGGITARVIERKRTAETFLSEATTLGLGSASEALVQQLVSRYGGHADFEHCGSNECSYIFSFDNGWLRRLHLAPYTRLTCTLSIANRVLVSRRIALISGNTPGAYAAFVEESQSPPVLITSESPQSSSSKTFNIDREVAGQNSDVRWRVRVSLTPSATPDQHRIAYDLNLDCLSRIGGCEDARRLLPSVSWGG